SSCSGVRFSATGRSSMRIRDMCTPLCVVWWFARGAKPCESLVGQGSQQDRHETLTAQSPVLPSLALYPNQLEPAAGGDSRKINHRARMPGTASPMEQRRTLQGIVGEEQQREEGQ